MPSVTHDVIVIGAGVAGLAAATEAAHCGLTTALFDDGVLGGLMINIGAVHGHHGAAQTSGADLVSAMLGEALEAGVDYQPSPVEALSNVGGTWQAAAVMAPRAILATGADLKRLGVPGEERLTGRGVSQCAFCDGGLYRGQDVAVVGGGDGAFQEALHLAELCASVTLILRGQQPRARPAFVRKAADMEAMRFRWCTEVAEILGEDGVDAVRLLDTETRDQEDLPVSAVFPFVGLAPKTSLAPADAQRDQTGALLVNADLATDQPGLFAIGAARAGYRGQVAHAMADGKTAAHAIWQAQRDD